MKQNKKKKRNSELRIKIAMEFWVDGIWKLDYPFITTKMHIGEWIGGLRIGVHICSTDREIFCGRLIQL